MTLDILRMDVTKDLLRKMAKEERCLFLALGHASNQVNALWKLVIVLTNGDENDPVPRAACHILRKIAARSLLKENDAFRGKRSSMRDGGSAGSPISNSNGIVDSRLITLRVVAGVA